MNREGSPPSSSYSSQVNGPKMFAAQTKQLIQGLFSSNETGSLALLGSNFKHNQGRSSVNCRFARSGTKSARVQSRVPENLV